MSDARAYHRLKNRARAASIALQLTFLAAFAYGGGEPLWGLLRRTGENDTLRRCGFILAFFTLWQALLWPLRWFSGWKLEKDFGLLKQDFIGWLADTGKSLALSAAFFLVSALVFYGVTARLGPQAWWALALLSFLFSAFFATLFPVWILPLFYKTAPLEDRYLEKHLSAALEHCGYPNLPLGVILLGQKTVRENAMLAGMGKTRRALLSDTLLSNYALPEIRMVLAHEAGHHARAHVARSLLIEAAAALAGFFLLFSALDVPRLMDVRFFPTLALISYLAGLVSMPLTNSLSRLHEREADRFALSRYPDLPVFRSLMEKLSERNLSNPAPGRWEEFFLYTHPSKRNRIAAGEKFLQALLANQSRGD